jgi:hypothetical protein
MTPLKKDLYSVPNIFHIALDGAYSIKTLQEMINAVNQFTTKNI